MVEVKLKYGETSLSVDIPDKNLIGVINPRFVNGVGNVEKETLRAISNPIKAPILDKIAKAGNKVAIVVDDHTRPIKSKIIVKPLLDYLNKIGIQDEDVTIIIGHGSHRKIRENEAENILGKEILERVNWIPHDASSEDLVYIGETSYKTKVYINKVFHDADIKILTGDVCLHYYAGYGGGRKSVLPAISGMETISHNHAMLTHPKATTGNLDGNPVHLDMTEAARLAKPDFIVNVVMNHKKEVVKAFAGDLEEAFMQGVKLVDQIYKVKVDKQADIVLVSAGGYPSDIDLYQAYKAIDSALRVVKPGGILVVAAECRDGHGHKVFYEWMKKYQTIEEMEKQIKTNFKLGGHKAYYILKAKQKADIILISKMNPKEVKNIFRLEPAKNLDDALEMAFAKKSKNAKIFIMPEAAKVLPELST
ncbi:MAG: nickel-dependent lactate racemase [Candidatus Baldrarchaeia archaeon]